ncbi:MAG TPA: PhzF family phenazine biosynthesis isomerase [Chloroflexi bacterium]|nr:PhzF family phenazine biosynthesis isomerase [Chloroflexota bacterium]
MQSELQLFQVDAFTATPFAGNPAAVCLVDAPLPEPLMMAIAAEMNLSETAFVQRLDDRPWAVSDRFALRWFTPTVEVPLCGHATLATAQALFGEVGVIADEIAFETRMSGTLTARREATGITLNFPADPPEPWKPPAALLAALGIAAPRYVGRNPRTAKVLVRVDEVAKIVALAPDFAALLAAAPIAQVRGVCVTAAGAPPYDFTSRYFAPWVGINEDPVTGSAHTVLAPYWAVELGQLDFFARQASARGGELRVRLLGERVALTGAAVVVLRGTLTC